MPQLKSVECEEITTGLQKVVHVREFKCKENYGDGSTKTRKQKGPKGRVVGQIKSFYDEDVEVRGLK